MLPTIAFMKYRKVSALISLLLICIAIGSLATRGLNYGLDFTGGNMLELEYPQDVDTEQIRQQLVAAGIENAVVQHFGRASEVAIRVPPQADQPKQQAEQSIGSAGEQLFKIVQQADPNGEQIVLKRNEFVGPSLGEELRDDGGIALIVALGLMLIYIAFRFHYRFGIGAVAALFHDVIIVLGMFSLTQLSVDQSVLAAVLAVIGYSLNDTIVVADRVRENFRDNLDSDDSQGLIDLSINQTLSRTIFTSLTTLLVLMSLYLFGGESLRLFSVALIAGIVVGTYSSIYVASSVLLSLNISPDQFVDIEIAEYDDGLP